MPIQQHPVHRDLSNEQPFHHDQDDLPKYLDHDYEQRQRPIADNRTSSSYPKGNKAIKI